MKRIILNIAIIAAAAGFTACDDNEPDTSITVQLAYTELSYDSDGVWTESLNPDYGAVVCQTVSFSHSATVSEWGSYWSGFCPSRSTDTSDHSSDWLSHQWSGVAGGGVAGAGTPYFAAYWNSSEGSEPGEAASLLIKLASGGTFTASSVYAGNSTYTYYTILNGDSYSKQFASGDYLKLLFYGVTANGTVTGPVEHYLADYRSENSGEWTAATGWEMVNLQALNANGPLSYIYIQMESSDTGQWGMNTPAYFTLDQLKINPAA